MLKDFGLVEFLDETASKSPVPGGGSVAALCSALAASLGAMVASLTIGKKNYESVEVMMTETAKDLQDYQKLFVDFIDKDASSFDSVMKAYKMPKETEAEKAKRSKTIQEGMKYAAGVPLELAEKTESLFPILEELVKKGNVQAQSDALVAAMLTRTAILSALFNVKINLASIKDEAYVSEIKARVKALEENAEKRESEILALSSY